jgi:hypothetical protein
MQSKVFEPFVVRMLTRACGCPGKTWVPVSSLSELLAMKQEAEVSPGVWVSEATWWHPGTWGRGAWVSEAYLDARQHLANAIGHLDRLDRA